MSQERFAQAVRAAADGLSGTAPGRAGGIGTLAERTLHAVLKYYYEPDETRHEIRVGRYVADIFGDGGIVEIQTRAMGKLRGKLEAFLKEHAVTVVYPVAEIKWLCWIDPETGQTTKRRRSPKRGTPADAFYELYRIRPLLAHPRLRVRIVLLEMEEYRLLNGWSHDRKRGAARRERIPLKLLDELALCRAQDYAALIPAGLPEPFTSRDFAAGARLSHAGAQTALNILHTMEAVKRVGKSGNSFLYLPASAQDPSLEKADE